MKLLILTAIALLPRILFVSSAVLTGDEGYYKSLATSIVNGEGLSIAGEPTSFMEPGYPYFLAVIYKLGYSVYLIQAFIGSLTCVMTYLIAKKLFNEKVAVVAFLCMAFNPAMIKICERLLSEGLFTFVVMLAVLILTRILSRKETRC